MLSVAPCLCGGGLRQEALHDFTASVPNGHCFGVVNSRPFVPPQGDATKARYQRCFIRSPFHDHLQDFVCPVLVLMGGLEPLVHLRRADLELRCV